MSLRKSKVIKIILHLLFWVAFVVMLNSEVLGLEWGPLSRRNGTFLVPLIFGMTINAILFYANAYWLIPEYLHKKHHKAFWIRSLVIIVGLTFFEIVFDMWYLYGSEALHLINPNAGFERNFSKMGELILFFTSTLIFNLFFWSMAFLYRWPFDWIRNERLKQQLVQDKLSAEIGFLKAQINPHFLFNGINSIYHLIGTDDKTAKNVLLRFSELLRYQLYECNEDSIPIKKELNYIKNYLSIEEIRKGEDATIKLDLPNTDSLDTNGLKIAPLLLTPFLENAFKYLSLYSEQEKNRL